MPKPYTTNADRYPNTPGWRRSDTSRDAAAFIMPHCGRLQGLFLETLRAAGDKGATSNEIAATLDLDHCSIRARGTELRAKNLIRDSGERRAFNGSPTRSIVWQLVEEEAHA